MTLHSTEDLITKAYSGYLGAWYSVTSRWPIGLNIFDRDWDLCIILDACRVDALRSVQEDYGFLDGIETVTSIGSTSAEWMAHTFVDRHADALPTTAIVSANAFTEWVLLDGNPPSDFGTGPLVSHENWSTVADPSFAHCELHYGAATKTYHDSRGITEKAITVGRTIDPDRLIVHYSRPHAPYTSDGGTDDLARYESDPFEYLKDGGDLRRVWEAYVNNLTTVLDYVDRLLSNYDAPRTVITADHGEGFGELGHYGHAAGYLHPMVKRVPWAETTAVDDRGYQPDVMLSGETATSVESRLADLGYRD